ncbi:MAG TPA: glycosyl hydrolase family 8 [Thermodesulfovibrionia bacterium]|nr:MAG: hypothetical protein A3J72_09705 [Nitrospirae bacterium RIFCSPHIGHO2_02_FULL_40_19]HLA49846.1 glycosyl hydrolase family 8 [Thermodesulfovibrionia bacterium]
MKSIIWAVIFFIITCGTVHAEDMQSLWEQYKSTFIQHDGRIIDKWQDSISHSEGQGYGMLNSVLYNDKVTFDTIWQWTKNNLQTRKDNLFAWSWGRRHNDEWGVIDYNNAADGDILIAYALVKASAKWDNANYKTDALKIIEGIRKNLSINWDNRTFILPAYYGFNKEDRLRINPSYLIFSAYKSFSEVDDKPFWEKVYKDSLYLIEKCYMGKLKLPPDWVVLNMSPNISIGDKTGISIDEKKGALSGYEAVRVILYLSWEKNPKFPDGVNEIFKIYEKLDYIPLYVDLLKNSISLDDAPSGFYAVYARAAEKTGNKVLSQKLFEEAAKKSAVEKDNYYSLSLVLLAAGSNDL